MASRLQDVILRGLGADKPLATDVAPGTLYHSSDLSITERSDGSTWQSYSDAGSGSVGAHAATHASGGADPVTLAQSQITNLTTDLAAKVATTDPRLTDPRTPLVHAPTHILGGTDPLDVKNLAGYPGTTTTFLRGDNTFSALPAGAIRFGAITMVIDGGSTPITTGVKGYLEIPFACTIRAVTLLANVAGSIVVDIWKSSYAAYPPVVGGTIVAGAKPTISAGVKGQDTVLTGWNTAIAAGDVLGFNVDSAATLTKVTLTLKVEMI